MEKVEILEKALSRILNKNNNNYIKTGFTDLDTMLCGTEEGSLVVIGGRPSMGKTSLMMSIFENLIKQKFRCLFFNLDTNCNSFMQRFLFQYTELHSTRVRLFGLTDKDTEKLYQSYDEIKEYDFCIDDNSRKIEEIEEKIKEYKPQYVFIDYLQLLYTNPEKHRCEELSKIILQLKNIAQENNVFVFLGSQLSRAVEKRGNKRPMLSDLKETDVIEDISDVVCFIYRENYYDIKAEPPFDEGKTEIIIAKNKFGAVGSTCLLFRAEFPKFFNPIESNIF